jgi:drug/metabolite transporter (DMT)-like permease
MSSASPRTRTYQVNSNEIATANNISSQGSSILTSEISLEDDNSKGISDKGDEISPGQNQIIPEQDKPNEPPEKTAETIRKDFNWWDFSRGIIYGFVSAGFAASSNFLVYLLLRRDNGLTVPLLLVARFSTMAILSMLGICYCVAVRNEDVFGSLLPVSDNKSTKTVVMMILRGVFAILIAGLHHLSLHFITPGESTTIMYGNPILVVIIARVIFKEKLTISKIFIALIAVAGVIVICRPRCLTGHIQFTIELFEGKALAVGAMLALTGVAIVLRILKDVHFLLVNAVFSIVALLPSIILAIFRDSFVSLVTISAQTYGMIIAMGVLAFGANMFQILTLEYEAVSVHSVVKSLDIVFSFLLQMTDGAYPDAIHIGGASLVIGGVCLIAFQKYLEDLPPEHPFRKYFWFILK